MGFAWFLITANRTIEHGPIYFWKCFTATKYKFLNKSRVLFIPYIHTSWAETYQRSKSVSNEISAKHDAKCQRYRKQPWRHSAELVFQKNELHHIGSCCFSEDRIGELTSPENPPTFSHQITVNLVILKIPSSRKTHLQAVASICFSVNDVKDIFLDFFALARKKATF